LVEQQTSKRSNIYHGIIRRKNTRKLKRETHFYDKNQYELYQTF